MAEKKVIIEIREGIFWVLDENCHSLLSEEANLLAALAFARGALDRVPVDNPFEFANNNTAAIIIKLSLPTMVNLMNAIRETSIMSISSHSEISASYKRGHATKQK